jgi:hypothetical protein
MAQSDCGTETAEDIRPEPLLAFPIRSDGADNSVHAEKILSVLGDQGIPPGVREMVREIVLELIVNDQLHNMGVERPETARVQVFNNANELEVQIIGSSSQKDYGRMRRLIERYRQRSPADLRQVFRKRLFSRSHLSRGGGGTGLLFIASRSTRRPISIRQIDKSGDRCHYALSAFV